MSAPTVTVSQRGRMFVCELDGVAVAWRETSVGAEQIAIFYRENPATAVDVLRRANSWKTAPGLAETARECRAEVAP